MHEQPRVDVTGDRVRRPAHPWTSTVHELLRHLIQHGVRGTPQPLALDGEVETLTLVPSTDGLVDAVIVRQEATLGHVRLLAAQGVQPQAGWVADGFLDELAQRVRWSQQDRHLVEQHSVSVDR